VTDGHNRQQQTTDSALVSPERAFARSSIRGRPSRPAAWSAAIGALLAFGLLGGWLMLGRGDVRALSVMGAAFTLAAVATPLYLLLESSRREYVVSRSTLVCRGGLLYRYELSVALDRIAAVSIHQDPVQRLLGCGDVRVFADGIGVSRGLCVTSADLHSIRLRSIPEFRQVGDALRSRVEARANGPSSPGPRATRGRESATLGGAETPAENPVTSGFATHVGADSGS
jgi:hypothetical protein